MSRKSAAQPKRGWFVVIERATRERQQEWEEPGNIRALLLIDDERVVDTPEVRALVASLRESRSITV